jgi:hypothetical protein
MKQMLLKATSKLPRIICDDKGLVKQVADGSIIKRFGKWGQVSTFNTKEIM